MATYSGNIGTCTWTVNTSDGTLTIGTGRMPGMYDPVQAPWRKYRSYIKTATITGEINPRLSNQYIDFNYAFYGLNRLRSVSGLSNLKRVSSLRGVFEGCTSLTSVDFTGFDSSYLQYTNEMFRGCSLLRSVDLSTFDMSAVKSVDGMFTGCKKLTSVTVGAWTFSSLNLENAALRNMNLVDKNTYYTAENTDSNITITSDLAFLKLASAERSGTWTRKTSSAPISCSATRTLSGVAEDDGADVTFTFAYTGSTEVTASIYQKLKSDTSYPATATYTTTVGNGTTTYTVSEIGDDALDFRVEVVSGGVTYVMFTSIISVVRLMDFDTEGNAHIYGNLTVKGDLTLNETNPVGDYVVEQSSDGIWTYRKWSSGIAECWGETEESYDITNGYGSMYYQSMSAVSLPSGLFTSAPMVMGQRCDTGGATGLVSVAFHNVNTTSFSGYIFSATSLSTNVRLCFHVVGTWK